MRIIEQPRPEDDLSSFGTVLRFAALVYENEEEGEANAPFEPYNIDGDVLFLDDRTKADAVFDAWVVSLRRAEDQFVEEGEEEGFVALLDTPKGLMILAGSNIQGYEGPDLDELGVDADARKFPGMPHITWERILQDLFRD